MDQVYPEHWKKPKKSLFKNVAPHLPEFQPLRVELSVLTHSQALLLGAARPKLIQDDGNALPVLLLKPRVGNPNPFM